MTFHGVNRIVSGLSLGTVIVEAARRSGSLITARFANEQGREVFAVPGSPLDPRAEGTNDLIREGATLCARLEDITSVIDPLVTNPRRADLFAEREAPAFSTALWDELELTDSARGPTEAEDAELTAPSGAREDARQHVIDLLGPSPVSLDDLVRLSSLRVGEVQSVLLDLELAGRLERHGGNLVSMPR